ncbi:uncharacterized [Tachysurus ichikawai]
MGGVREKSFIAMTDYPSAINFQSVVERSEAFPTKLPSPHHKAPRNPAACLQLIFPVATLLTPPPIGRVWLCPTGHSAPPPNASGQARQSHAVRESRPLSTSEIPTPIPTPNAGQVH